MKLKIKKLIVKRDQRGWLTEILRPEDVDKTLFGQIMLTTAYPGKAKGNHYHERKREWYCVIAGKGLLKVIDRKTRQIEEIVMDAENPVLVEIPTGSLHTITNMGNCEMILLTYTDEPFDLHDPDTFYES